MTPVAALGVPAKRIDMSEWDRALEGVSMHSISLPDLGISLHTEPVRKRAVLLLLLGELNLGAERLVGRLYAMNVN